MPKHTRSSAAIVFDLASLRHAAAEMGTRILDDPSDIPFPAFTRPIMIHDRAGLKELAAACGRDLEEVEDLRPQDRHKAHANR